MCTDDQLASADTQNNRATTAAVTQGTDQLLLRSMRPACGCPTGEQPTASAAQAHIDGHNTSCQAVAVDGIVQSGVVLADWALLGRKAVTGRASPQCAAAVRNCRHGGSRVWRLSNDLGE
jgi:hypothetical protein